MRSLYSASITGEPFLFYEIRQVAKLKVIGKSDKQIKEEVLTNNLFQYGTEKSINRRLLTTLKRAKVLNESQINILANGSFESAKIINLYAIMSTNKLVYEFIAKAVVEKISTNNKIIEKKDLNEFFTAMSEQNEVVAGWKDYTIYKLKQVLLRIIFEAGIITDKDKGYIHRISIEPEVRKYFDDACGKVLLSISETWEYKK